MATAEQIKALLESHVEGDDDRFLSIVLQLAARAARQGHGKLAQELRAMIDKARVSERSGSGSRHPVPLAQPRGELAGLLSASYPTVRLTDMILASEIREHLERVLLEHRQRDKLADRVSIRAASCCLSDRRGRARRTARARWPASFTCRCSVWCSTR
jgi:hypothetical protein